MLRGNTYSLSYELYGPTYINESMLNEGITDGLLKDGIQFLVSGAAEYGLGGITLPAYGAGLAIGPAVETIVDSMFAAESIKSAIDAFNSVNAMFGEYKELIQNAYEAYDVANLENYYDSLKDIVQRGFKDMMPEGMADKFEEKIEGFKNVLKKIIKGIIEPIKSGIKLVVPDATLSLAAAKFIQELLEKLAENAFTMFAEGVNQFETLKNFLADPDKAIDFFKDIFQQLSEMLENGAKKIDDKGWASSMLSYGPSGAFIIKKLGPAGLNKASDLLKSTAPTIVEIISKVLKVIIPMMITALALFQIVMKGDYMSDETDEEVDDLEDKSEDKKDASNESKLHPYNKVMTESRLRKIIRSEIIVQAHHTR